jgi:hypothetical protein
MMTTDAAAERPVLSVTFRVPVGIGRAGAGEGDRQRGQAGGRCGRHLRHRGVVAAHEVDPGELGVGVLGAASDALQAAGSKGWGMRT